MVRDMARAPVFEIEISDKVSGSLKLISHAITVEKTNSDEWMVKFVSLSNAFFLSMGQNVRLRYKNGEIESLGFEDPPRFREKTKRVS